MLEYCAWILGGGYGKFKETSSFIEGVPEQISLFWSDSLSSIISIAETHPTELSSVLVTILNSPILRASTSCVCPPETRRTRNGNWGGSGSVSKGVRACACWEYQHRSFMWGRQNAPYDVSLGQVFRYSLLELWHSPLRPINSHTFPGRGCKLLHPHLSDPFELLGELSR